MSAALNAASTLIAASRQPLVTGLETDVAGIRGAVALALACGGVIDHARSSELYDTLDVLRTRGLFVGAPAEIRRRADRFFLVGGDAASLVGELVAFVLGGALDLGRGAGGPRKLVWLGAPAGATPAVPGLEIEAVACPASSLVDALAMMRAASAGRRLANGPISADRAGQIAEVLKGAAFGCALWSPADLGSIGVEMLAGLVADLNEATRFTGIALDTPGHALGAAQATTWLTGYPLRVGFGLGSAEHDPWRFETRRLIAAGESDLVVHVSALAGVPPAEPEWAGTVATIAVTGAEPTWRHPPRVAFRVAIAGEESDAVLWEGRAASFVPVAASASVKDLTGAGDMLAAIAAQLPGSRFEGRAA